MSQASQEYVLNNAANAKELVSQGLDASGRAPGIAVGQSLQVSAAILGGSKSVSTENSGGVSDASAAASREIDRLLGATEEGLPDAILKEAIYRKARKFSSIQLADAQVAIRLRFVSEEGEREYIEAAVEVSQLAYKKKKGDATRARENDITIKAKSSGGKALYVRQTTLQGRNALIIGIRGTAKLSDWPLNLNNLPFVETTALRKEISWHRGFRSMALDMEMGIVELIKGLHTSEKPLSQLLFTGHSAGGAIAQIFLARSNQDTELGKAVQGFDAISCITFGAPPVVNPPIDHSAGHFFLSIVNNGDLVALAQTNYIKVLLDIFVLPLEKVNERAETLVLPEPVFMFSGKTLVILKDEVVREDDPNKARFRFVPVEVSQLKQLLFGSPMAHHMEEYQRRVESAIEEEGVEKSIKT